MFEFHNSYEKIRRRYADLMNNMMTINIKEDNVHLMNISLIPFSLLQVPHIIVITLSRPRGAIRISTSLSRSTQSVPGNTRHSRYSNSAHV